LDTATIFYTVGYITLVAIVSLPTIFIRVVENLNYPGSVEVNCDKDVRSTNTHQESARLIWVAVTIFQQSLWWPVSFISVIGLWMRMPIVKSSLTISSYMKLTAGVGMSV
jgi:hypothetical protein